MITKIQWKQWVGTGITAGAVAFAALSFQPQTLFAQSEPETPAQEETVPAQPAAPMQRGMRPESGVREGRYGHGMGGDTDAALAEALGITADELTAARDAAKDAALDQAVADGLLTQEQADAIRSGEGHMGGFRLPRQQDSTIDMDALLADALGITVDELEAAENTARDTILEQAVADGELTQEQADLIKARAAFKEFAKNGDYATIEEALAAAVDAGVITEAQSELIQRAPQHGERGGRGGMHGSRGGRGGFSGNGQSTLPLVDEQPAEDANL